MVKELTWELWCEVFNDPEFFRPIIFQIYEKEGMEKPAAILGLTPGTNGVFKVDGHVIKIFVPTQVKKWSEDDFEIETFHIDRAVKLGINTPKIIASGFVVDRYKWEYLLLEYLDAAEAGHAVKKMPEDQKRAFAFEIRSLVDKMNDCDKPMIAQERLVDRVILGQRWKAYPHKIQEALADYLSGIDLKACCYVHGDLTAENVMIDKVGHVHIIDFADTTIAPSYYEHAPICFDLFGCDKTLIRYYFEGLDDKQIIEELYKGLLIHDFGGEILKILMGKCKNRTIQDLSGLDQIKEIISEATGL
ncbi:MULTISPECIES: phosphotransferase family protein [unclassified Fusibacter]|uniref:phosphotransferase family protein n=1 Tax=unclassified Fusibacter TaxID=2624464 RepID=UPI0010112812|nr:MULTISPECIES: aminoglycoside phosphotransferase family protein [unclassified Fusibacter]MCK8060139.1 aminoglycoside phosphotransferase family protein [Fusibacter sp. A2]NPE22281.1 aminoglycoside phosphotransferase family protein [Fusibacter sp. A1]RXV61054.1 aminoglycoside phosphotransferase family protein [Fusibacter sp. A1]